MVHFFHIDSNKRGIDRVVLSMTEIRSNTLNGTINKFKSLWFIKDGFVQDDPEIRTEHILRM